VDRSSSAKRRYQFGVPNERALQENRQDGAEEGAKRLIRHRGGKISTVMSTEREMRVTDSRVDDSVSDGIHDTLIDDLFQPAVQVMHRDASKETKIQVVDEDINPFQLALEASTKQSSQSLIVNYMGLNRQAKKSAPSPQKGSI
jgi:hypothetical protein